MGTQQLKDEIIALKKKRNAVILAHNYQNDDIQDIADYTGDSLELARRAAAIDAETIVFCGVSFMAETAAVLNPGKTVLLPVESAGCPMADMITGKELNEFKKQHPEARVLCYVNSTAEVKAESDICVTSSNAHRVASSLPENADVIFVPDQHLGKHTADRLKRDFILWNGYCPIHAKITAEAVAKARALHPGAVVMVHPECAEAVRNASDEVLSTGEMCSFANKSESMEFIVGTEIGILHRLKKENPNKKFYPLMDNTICPDMKKITLEDLRDSLLHMRHRVTVDPVVAAKARVAVENMLSIP